MINGVNLHLADGAAQERAKYAEIWSSIPEYRNFSPGLVNVGRFMSVLQPRPGASLIDIGCGAGVAGLAFEQRGFDVTYLDITDAGLEPAVDRSKFIQAPLWSHVWRKHRTPGWDFGFCCDVLEHIPTEYTMLVLERIVGASATTWLQISLKPDNFGRAIGEPLHLTVRPFQWWLVRLATLGHVIEARDLCGDGLYIVGRA